MSRKTERDTARDEDPHSEVPDWLEELLEGKSDRERSKILREYRDEVMCAKSNPRSLRKLKPELESSGWPAASWVHTPTGSIISHMDDGHWAVSNRAGKPVREFKTAAEAVQFVSTHRNPVKPRHGESERSFVSRCMSEEKRKFPDRKQRIAVCLSKSRRNPYVESGAYIVADNDINRQASKMG